MVEIPLVSISLATICIESFLYGIFFTLFLFSIYLLVVRHNSTVSNRSSVSILLNPFFFASLCIFVTVTAHWVINFFRLFEAFVIFNGGQTPASFFSDLSQLTEVLKTGFLVASVIVGDTMLIYRLWIVWSYNKAVVIFPLCTLIGLTVSGVGITVQFTQYSPGQNVFVSEAGRWITSDCVFTLCTNLYSSVLIAWRIWKVNSSARHYGGQNLNSVLAIVVESAAIYTSWTIFFLTSYQARSNLQFLGIDGLPLFSGIAFMLINVRVGLGWAHNASPSFVSHPIPAQGSLHSRGVVAGPFAMQPLAVNIRKVVENDDHYNIRSKTSEGADSL